MVLVMAITFAKAYRGTMSNPLARQEAVARHAGIGLLVAFLVSLLEACVNHEKRSVTVSCWQDNEKLCEGCLRIVDWLIVTVKILGCN